MKRYLVPTQAAHLIGCTPSQVRRLIRTGKLRAKRVRSRLPGDDSFYYMVRVADAEAYRDKQGLGGWPRGKKRNDNHNHKRKGKTRD